MHNYSPLIYVCRRCTGRDGSVDIAVKHLILRAEAKLTAKYAQSHLLPRHPLDTRVVPFIRMRAVYATAIHAHLLSSPAIQTHASIILEKSYPCPAG